MKIESYAAACAALKIDPAFRPDVSQIPEVFRASHVAHFQLMVWVEASNADNPADWSNPKQTKYEPVFKWSASAGAFVYYGCVGWLTGTRVGARLCFTDWDDLNRTVEIPEFMELVNNLLTRPA